MGDRFNAKDGKAVTDVLDGFYDAGGKVPCQIDGGLKCFGHPIGASGLRMAYEVYNQLLGRAADRQLKDPTIGLTHNLGGVPYQGIAAISILGLHCWTARSFRPSMRSFAIRCGRSSKPEWSDRKSVV